MTQLKPKTQNLKPAQNKVLSVHQPQYIPWLGYFDKISQSDLFVYLDCCQYKHREFQNRNRILTANGELWLAVSVLVKGRRDQIIKDVEINQDSDWQKSHWKSIFTAYAKAPCFKSHASFFEDIYLHKEWKYLIDLNVTIVDYIMKQLKIDTPIKLESDIGTSDVSTERIIELCKKTESGVYLSGAGAKAYMQEERFVQEDIELQYQNFKHPEYQQFNNKEDFKPYMSTLDYLFNCI